MMSRKREAIIMGIGILTGIILCGPAAQAATTAVTATLSNQAIYCGRQAGVYDGLRHRRPQLCHAAGRG